MSTVDDDVAKSLKARLFSLNKEKLEQMCFDVFKYQYNHNLLYKSFCEALTRSPANVHEIEKIPFLPISLFKTHTVISGERRSSVFFESSGTTGQVTSKHHNVDTDFYEANFTETFVRFYGDPAQYCIIGLLPSYLERSHSSLVHMVSRLIALSKKADSGFFLYDHQALHELLLRNEKQKIKTIIFGVTYALLDFYAAFPTNRSYCIIIETGGMKGRRQELTREEVHTELKNNSGLPHIHSEYGMTELLSQAYSGKEGIFKCPPFLKICIRQEDDPLSVSADTDGKEIKGLINIIDLGNIDSCAFIATDDIGILYPDSSFKVLGRLDHSDVRGCALMVSL